ncbi:MAG: 30S ribosomal protein S16 [Deltaproteobacteria bacterium]|nr:30S ribosomal protein S16 [Deltaproteobacteria bacterium]
MAVKLRLMRVGARSKPSYRIVVIDSHAACKGAAQEVVGFYDPRQGIEKAKVDGDRVRYWLGCGAQPSVVVGHILKKAGVGKAA